MVTQTYAVAFRGIDAIPVTVQVQIASGNVAFHIVGLPDKAVSEARERVRAALSSAGIALPAKRILVSLSPADLPKEGGHYDVPIALALLAEMDVIPKNAIENCVSIGELSLSGKLTAVSGILPAAVTANHNDYNLVCAKDNALEACWINHKNIIAADTLLDLIHHFKNDAAPSTLEAPTQINTTKQKITPYDLSEIRGQETAKQALEITAAGGHNMLMSGPPGAGKSMLASCLPDLLPPLLPQEMLETSLIASISGKRYEGGLCTVRPYRAPHHSASMAALVGGGRKAAPGEISLAHSGILFLDELPEFKSDVLDSLRQPLETGKAVIARAEHHVTYPSSFQLVAAMNPCKCGYLSDPKKACSRAPRCGRDYSARISGPLLDRFDVRIELAPVSLSDLSAPIGGETSVMVKERVQKIRDIQEKRAEKHQNMNGVSQLNSKASGEYLDHITQTEENAKNLLLRACEKLGVTARGYHRILRVARTVQDMQDLQNNVNQNDISKLNTTAIATALAFRMN